MNESKETLTRGSVGDDYGGTGNEVSKRGWSKETRLFGAIHEDEPLVMNDTECRGGEAQTY